MRFNNIALGFMTFYESVCVYIQLTDVTVSAIYPLPNTIHLPPARIELDFSETTMKVIKCDGKTEREGTADFLLQLGKRSTVLMSRSVNAAHFGVGLASTVWFSKVTL